MIRTDIKPHRKISDVICACGCGQNTLINLRHRKPNRFIDGHNSKIRGKKKRYVTGIYILNPSHARSHESGYVLEHILVAEKVLGKPLPPKAVVHHHNKDRTDNRHQNLVICENQGYHLLLHLRERAYKACGNANWRKCKYCKEYDDPNNLYIYKNTSVIHIECARLYQIKMGLGRRKKREPS